MKAFEKFALILGAVIVVGSASPVFADYVVDAFEPVVVSDDIYNTSTEVVSLAGPSNKTNNGHGNNEDGVDSSNPGKGGGGPNGAEDTSCNGDGPCVDDEKGKKK